MKLSAFIRKYILPDFEKVRGRVIISMVLLVITTVSQVASIEAARALIQVLQIRIAGSTPSGFVVFLSDFLRLEPSRLFFHCAAVAVALPVIAYVLMYLRDINFELVSIKITKLFQDRVYSKVIQLPYERFKEFRAATLVKRISYDSAQIRRLVLDVGLFRLTDLIILIGIVAYMIVLDFRLTAISALALTLYWFLAWLSAGVAAERIFEVDRSREELSGFAQESFERFLDIRANLREGFEVQRFSEITDRASRTKRRHAFILLFDKCMTGVLSDLGPVLVMVAGGVLVLGGTVSLETLMAFIAATNMLYGPVDRLSAIPMTLKEVQVSVNNLDDILRHESEGEGQVEQISPPPAPALAGAPPPFLSVEDLEFEFPDAKRRFRFSRLNLREGERVGLVGPSGAGKTTMLLLLFRIYGGYKGGIYLRGRELRDIPLAELRGRVGLMLQDNFIFADTVESNVAYGSLAGANPSSDDIMTALRRARLAEEVARLPQGLQTLLAHMGSNLSGGQRRRLSLSRAIIKRPELLLLDEPLTGVPPMEVHSIIEALTQEALGTTLLISTHQAEILKGMDRVVVLDTVTGTDGYIDTVIAASGSHEQLVESSPFYQSQFGDQSVKES